MEFYLLYTDITFMENDFLMAQARRHLNEDRIKRAQRCQKKEDRLRSIAAGLLLEYGLQKYGLTQKQTEGGFRQAQFEFGRNGKPLLKNQMPPLFFNLSHSGNYAAAVFSSYPVGLDIETIRVGQQKIVNHFFSEDEKAYLNAHWNDREFTKIWTRKESYIKANGKGMAMPLDSFSVLENQCGDYFMKSFFLKENVWLSVCQMEKEILGSPMKVDLTRGLL